MVAADTVGLDVSDMFSIEWFGNSGGSLGYFAFAAGNNGNYVEVDTNASTFFNVRLLVQYTLPTLAGMGVVDSVRMYHYLCAVTGNALTDSVIVDHVNWGAAIQDSASWGGQIVQGNIGTLVRDTTLGWKSMDVTSSIQADYAAKRPNSQYRFGFASGTMPIAYQAVQFALCGDQNLQNNAGQSYMVIWAH